MALKLLKPIRLVWQLVRQFIAHGPSVRGLSARLVVMIMGLWLAMGTPEAQAVVEVPCDGCDLYDVQWHLSNQLTKNPWGYPITTPGDINIEPAWQRGFTGDRTFIVAIIDTGVDIQHPELRDNIYKNPDEIADNGVDDDHNGYVDDVHGWNFVKQSSDVRDPAGHGTHIAGVIGADRLNGIGVRGINQEVALLPIVVLGKDINGQSADTVSGIYYAIEAGARVINLSLGGFRTPDFVAAMHAAEDAGILVVNSAGNDGENIDLYPYFPASYHLDNMIVVGATNHNNLISGGSNYGRRTLDILAPGLHILSTLPDNRYGYMTGTSMAAPQVAGAAALLWSAHPDWDLYQVKERLLKSSKFDRKTRNRAHYGHLDVAKALSSDKVGDDHYFPGPEDWQGQAKATDMSFRSKGIYKRKFVAPAGSNAVALRLELANLSLRAGTHRIVVEDEDQTAIQIIDAATTEPVTTHYVFGREIWLRFVISENSQTPLEAELTRLEWVSQP